MSSYFIDIPVLDPAQIPTASRVQRNACPARRVPRLTVAPAPARVAEQLPVATDLSLLQGKAVLIVADAENLTYSLRREHDSSFDYDGLLTAVRRVAKRVTAWAAYTVREDGSHPCTRLAEQWERLEVPQTVGYVDGRLVRKANADLYVAGLSCLLAARKRIDAVLVGTGDGDLGLAIARTLKLLPSPPQVYALGVPGCISSRLRAGGEGALDGSVSVGRDLARAA